MKDNLVGQRTNNGLERSNSVSPSFMKERVLVVIYKGHETSTTEK